jgi:hypothetical protein
VRFNTDCVVCNQFQTVHAAELHRAPNESKKASQSSFTTAAVYLASKRTKSVYGGNDLFTEDNSEYLRLQAVYYCRQTNFIRSQSYHERNLHTPDGLLLPVNKLLKVRRACIMNENLHIYDVLPSTILQSEKTYHERNAYLTVLLLPSTNLKVRETYHERKHFTPDSFIIA